jgi:multidrug efflux pump
MKSFTEIFIKRPVLAVVVTLVIIIAGLQAISSLNVRQYPKSESAVVTIITVYVGADAELVRGFVTTPIEQVIAEADGIDYIESTSAQGISTINVWLKLNYEGTKALSEISSKVDRIRANLPPSAEVPAINITPADSQFATAYISFSSETLERNKITDYLLRVVQPRLSAIQGVQRAEIMGGRTFAARIWLKPDRMAALSISPSMVRQAVTANNVLSAPGNTKGSLISVDLTANTDMRSIQDFKRLVIKQEGNAIVRLEDIADVVLGSEFYDIDERYSGTPSTTIGIFVLPNANALDTMEGVIAEMAALQEDLPAGIQALVNFDATEYIRSAISEVIKTLSETLLIVVLVIFLFLGSVRSVIIPVIAIPVSLIGSVFIMQVFGFTINLLTLLAIVLSVGLVVDDAIVVVENVDRNLRKGKSPLDAAIFGVRELVGPIIAMTITLAAVYAPIGFQGGVTGALFKEFAFTLTGAVLISGVVALTLSPMMSAGLLKPSGEDSWLKRKINRRFDALRRIYGRILDGTLSSRGFVYFTWIVLSALTLFMFNYVQQNQNELAPTEDQGIIMGILSTPSNSTIEQTSLSAVEVNRIWQSFPETDYTFQVTQPTFGFGGMIVSPWDEREKTVFELLPEVQRELSTIPGVRVTPILPPALPGAGVFPVELVIVSTAESEQILEFAGALTQKAMASSFFPFLDVDVKIDKPQAEIVIDRDKVASLGLDLADIGNDLSSMFGGNYVNRFNIDGRSYKVIPQIKRKERLNPDQLTSIYVTGPEENLIPLSAIATIERKTVPRSLNRFQQFNSVKIAGVTRLPLDSALSFLEEEAAKILPQGFNVDYTGESRQLRAEGNSFLASFLLAVVLIFLVLAAQFNSFRDPLIILLGSVPLAMFGAVTFMFLKFENPQMPFWTDEWTTTLNIFSKVGLITLVGIVSKNGILIVEFANQLQREGLTKLAAIKEAGLTRLRPVLMTSSATVCGHFPLVLVTGAGAEARNSIGLVIVAGMAIGTFFTLLIIPSVYMLIAKNHGGEAISLEAEEAVQA